MSIGWKQFQLEKVRGEASKIPPHPLIDQNTKIPIWFWKLFSFPSLFSSVFESDWKMAPNLPSSISRDVNWFARVDLHNGNPSTGTRFDCHRRVYPSPKWVFILLIPAFVAFRFLHDGTNKRTNERAADGRGATTKDEKRPRRITVARMDLWQNLQSHLHSQSATLPPSISGNPFDIIPVT